jgi:transposase InsO family protein
MAPEQTFHDRVVLHWDNGLSRRTVYLDPNSNVATLNLAPDYKRFGNFCLEAEISDSDDLLDPCCVKSSEVVEFGPEHNQDETFHIPTLGQHGLNGPHGATVRAIVREEQLDTERGQDTAKFLQYHLKFNHASPVRIQAMAKAGTIPSRLVKCPILVCTMCLFGKATRKPWQHKHLDNAKQVQIPTIPGKVISVDQMISPTPGLVAQMTGKHTLARYCYATVFIDHASDLSFIHLQKTATVEETMEAKEAFERYAKQHGVLVQHYHSNNGVFTSHAWRDHCTDARQGLSFSGVNAHHQNGRAERRIRELQESARTMLIHAHRRWPQAISANLWPYAMRMANDAINIMPSIKNADAQSPLSTFAGSQVNPNPNDWHHFGCPVYVLDVRLQSNGAIFDKWRQRSRVGIYLGRSPQHARSVALVLNPESGLVSPQFHISFDSSFQTLDPKRGEASVTSMWQEKAGFVELQATRNVPNEANLEGEPSPQIHKPSSNEGDEWAGLPIEAYFPTAGNLPTMQPINETHENPLEPVMVETPSNPPEMMAAPSPTRHNPRPLRNR